MITDKDIKITNSQVWRELRVSKQDFLHLLEDSKVLSRRIPYNAEVTVTVPSGGDFSGDSLDLDEAGGLTISWVEPS